MTRKMQWLENASNHWVDVGANTSPMIDHAINKNPEFDTIYDVYAVLDTGAAVEIHGGHKIRTIEESPIANNSAEIAKSHAADNYGYEDGEY